MRFCATFARFFAPAGGEGAGVSFLSRNMEDENLPDGASLVDILLEQPRGKGSKHPLDRIADHVVRNKGVDFVYDLLKRKLTVKSVDSKLTCMIFRGVEFILLTMITPSRLPSEVRARFHE